MHTQNTLSVELKGVTKRFGEVAAVNHIDLQVAKGEFFSLLGPSGCGKTTTLRLIGGLETPDEGDVLINGEYVNNTPPYERNASIVFQNLALFPHMTIEQNIAFGLKLKKTYTKGQIQAAVAEMLDLVQLGGLGKRRPDQLSGGQQQRVALARSLVLQPEVLLLDEPLAALDRKLRKEMQVELRGLQRDLAITFIYVTHDQKEALSMSGRIAVMNDGVIAQLGSPTEIYERPSDHFVADFMGVTNVFEGNGVKGEANTVKVLTESGLEVVASAIDGRLIDHAPVSFSVRPEAIQLHGNGDETLGENAFEGKVAAKIYLGESIEVEVNLSSGDRVVAYLSTAARSLSVEEGQTVWVTWAAADTNLLLNSRSTT